MTNILTLIAIICFVLAAVGLGQWDRVSLLPLGLAFWAAAGCDWPLRGKP